MAKRAPKADPDAPLVLTAPSAKPARKAAKRSSAKAMHKRTRKEPTVATVRMVDGVGFILDVNDVLTKNERYNHIIIGTPRKFGGGGQRAAPVPSPAAVAYKEAVKLAAAKCSMSSLLTPMVRRGLWRLEILSIWPTERHHQDGTNTANGDSDAPIAMVKDAMQHAGIIDDDMRIVGETTHAVYRKGERRTVAVLRMVSAESHAEGVAAVLGVLG